MQGAIYFNGYYPGHIGLPQNTAYAVFCDETETMVHVVRHVRPIVVTDFGNDFQSRSEHPESLVSLRNPIPQCPEGSPISADLGTPDGSSEIGFLCTKDHEYQLYRRRAFTEVTIGVEAETFDPPNAPTGRFFNEALEQFLLIYRVVTIDTQVEAPSRLLRDIPMIRSARVQYGRVPRRSSCQQRLLAHLPPTFQLETFSYREFSRDIPDVKHDPVECSVRIGHHLAARTQISTAQVALSDAAQTAFLSGNARFGVVDAASIAEFAAFDFLNDTRKTDAEIERRAAKREAKGDLTFKVVINSFLPGLLSAARAQFPDVIGDLDKLRKKRNKILHERREASGEEAVDAMNVAQRLLFAIELSGGATIAVSS